MTDILSQTEIDQLLNAISSGEIQAEEFKQPKYSAKVKIFDPRRPDYMSRNQIRKIHTIHQIFTRVCETQLTSKLGSIVKMYVTSVDQLTYEEFMRCIHNPSTVAILDLTPLKGNTLIEIDPSIQDVITNRLFGGNGPSNIINRKELTDIQLSSTEGIIVAMLGGLREAWYDILDIRPRLISIETNIPFIQICHPNDMMILTTIETIIDGVEGMINIAIPYNSIREIADKLEPTYQESKHSKKSNIVENVTTNLNITIDSNTYITLSEFNNLKKGNIIELNKIEAFLTKGSKKLFKAKPKGSNFKLKEL